MKKFIIMAIFVLSTLLIVTACSTESVKSEPEISLNFNVSNLTDEEFLYVGTKRLDNPTQNDFKNIEFTLDVKNSEEISNRKITIPDLKAVSNSYDKSRYWFGNFDTDDSPINKYAKYSSKFVFYSNGLTEHDIKNIFNSSEVKISWTASNGKNEEKTIKLGEVIKFQS